MKTFSDIGGDARFSVTLPFRLPERYRFGVPNVINASERLHETPRTGKEPPPTSHPYLTV